MEEIGFGDIEAAVKTQLTTRLASKGRAVTVHSAIPDRRPTEFVTVVRGGGTADFVIDGASVEVECFSDTRENAASLARLARAIVFGIAGQTISSLVVYRVTEYAGPAYLPHPTAGHRYVFTAAFYFRGATV
jgi:hypothetical protein